LYILDNGNICDIFNIQNFKLDMYSIPVILALQRLRDEDRELKVRLSFIVSLCLKKKKKVKILLVNFVQQIVILGICITY
jgi:hypothetical protein